MTGTARDCFTRERERETEGEEEKSCDAYKQVASSGSTGLAVSKEGEEREVDENFHQTCSGDTHSHPEGKEITA